MKTNLTRLRRRSVRGTRLTGSAPFGKWGTQTLIAGLTQDGLIAPRVIKGAMDGDAFAACANNVLVPELQAGTQSNKRFLGSKLTPAASAPAALASS